MWHPSWSIANSIYELSTIVLLVGVFATGIGAAGIFWMAPIRDAYLKDAARAALQATTVTNGRAGHTDLGKENPSGRVAEPRSPRWELTQEQVALLSASLGDLTRQILIIRTADPEAATLSKQFAAAFERAKIPARVGVIERDASSSGVVLFDPDERRGAALAASFEQARIEMSWERRLHPRFPGQPILLVGKTSGPN